MDQQSHDVIPPVNMPQPNMEVPVQHGEQMLAPITEQVGAAHVEQGMSNPLPMVSPSNTAVGAQPQTHPLPTTQGLGSAALTPPLAGSPAIADDSDLIEKEWVEKAKAIVNQTKHDPYVQNTEMNKMKADYMKKRYNKDLKLASEQ